MSRRTIQSVGDFRALPIGAVVRDAQEDLMMKRVRGWTIHPHGEPDGPAWSDEELAALGHAQLISTPNDDLNEVTVAEEFTVQGENDWGVQGSMPLYLMSDGTLRWKKP